MKEKLCQQIQIKQGHDLLNEVWGQLPDAYFSKYQLAQLTNQAKTVAASKGKTSVFVNTRKILLKYLSSRPIKLAYF